MREGLTFDDVLIEPRFSEIRSRSECNPSVVLGGKVKLDVPIISANMDTITGGAMMLKMSALGGLGILHRYMDLPTLQVHVMRCQEEANLMNVGYAVGTLENDKARIDFLIQMDVDIICIDIAHGNSIQMVETIKYVRGAGFSGLLIAGNVATRDGARRLTEAGADVIKVGIGPGSVCTTRTKTGCGIPQFSAIRDCSGMTNSWKPDIEVIADGGIRTPGDAAKALAAGAKAVMIGGLLAGTDCVPGWSAGPQEVTVDPSLPPRKVYEHRMIEFRGMASKEARTAFLKTEATNAEGVARFTLARPPGSTEAVINDIVEGVRSAMSYVGATNLEELHEHATFIRVTPATVVENSPHFKS